MRQIEFRGLRKDGKGWVYGCYSIYRGKTDGPILHRISWDDGHNGFFAEVDPSTVGQFTGLPGGIYKDDIVQDSVGRIWIVDYIDEIAAFVFRWEKDPDQFLLTTGFNGHRQQVRQP